MSNLQSFVERHVIVLAVLFGGVEAVATWIAALWLTKADPLSPFGLSAAAILGTAFLLLGIKVVATARELNPDRPRR